MYCSQCGAQAHNGANFCTQCGVALGNDTSSAGPPAVSPRVLAGFWRRYAAALIDAGLIGLFILPFLYLDVSSDETSYALFTGPFIALFYFVLCEGLMQSTPGKFFLGIKVTDGAGNKIGLGRAALRLLGKFIMAATLGIGFIICAFNGKRRALDDMIAGTLVVARVATPEAIVRATPTTMGFSASVGVLAGALTLAVVMVPELLRTLHYFWYIPPSPEVLEQLSYLSQFHGAFDPDIRIIPSEMSLGGGAAQE